MSLYEACGWTLLRSLAITIVVLPICFGIHRRLGNSTASVRKLLWWVLLVPFFAPDLVVGYSYRNFALSLVHHPFLNELFYALLVTLKVISVGVVVLHFSPSPPVSPSALHTLRLAAYSSRHKNRWLLFSGYIHGQLQAAFPAAAVVFLLSFQEFDLASMLGTTSWTVWLFDQNAQGLMLGESLRLCMLPVICELVVLGPLLLIIVRSRPAQSPHRLILASNQMWHSITFWAYAVVANIVLVAIPFVIVFQKSLGGINVLASNVRFLRNIATSGAFAVTAGLVVFLCARWIVQSFSHVRTGIPKKRLTALLLIPGLFGALVLGLVLLSAFQTPPLRWLYDTPLPLLLGFVLLLLPKACVLQFLATTAAPQHGIHLGHVLTRSPVTTQRNAGRETLWQLRAKPHFWILVLLCYWLYLELTVSYLLYPTGPVPVSVLIYGFVHYGSMSMLAAMVTLTMAAMLASLLLVLTIRRRVIGWLFT